MTTKIKPGVIADAAVENAAIAGNAVTTDKVALDTLTAADLAPDSVGTSEVADGTIGAADLAATLDLSGKTLTLPAANTPALTKSFISAGQTITAAGALTLAHGLGVTPKLVQIWLKCTTAEHGYSINDEVPFFTGDQNANRGASCMPDATNMNVRYGSAANTFNVLHKTTGASSAITNASWQMIVKAWA